MLKRIYYIACNELYSLFYSPIAWLMMILFLILTSVDYMYLLHLFVTSYERGGSPSELVQSVTDMVVSKNHLGYFPKIIDNGYIFFPLITMGLISREVSSGTIRLLYSSPVRIAEVVLGKFLSMVFFTLALLLLVSFTLIGFCWGTAHPDYEHIAGAMVALFLVLCTYAAIGLFLSSLTSYQIVAALLTFALFAFLSRVGDLWQDTNVLRDIAFYLNLRDRGQKLLDGLFNLRDLMYFIMLIMAFLSYTFIRIYSSMESISWVRKAGRYLAVGVIVFIIGYATSRQNVNVYSDLTRDKIRTITPPTQAMLAKLNEGPLEITAYGNLLKQIGYILPKDQNYIKSDFFERYIRFKPDIHLNFKYYYAIDTGADVYKQNPTLNLQQIAAKRSKTYRMKINSFLDSAAVSKEVDVAGEDFRNLFLLRYKGRSTILRTFSDNIYWPMENEVAAALNRLITTPPKVVFISDQIARGPFSYKPRDYYQIADQRDLRYNLLNQGYDFDTVSLERMDIPRGITALVIADPRTPFSDTAMKKICRYIEEGGNLLIAGEADRKDVLRPLLDTLGLSMEDGMLVQPSDNFSSDLVFTHMTDPAKHLSPQFDHELKDMVKYFGDSVFNVGMGGAAVLRYHEKDGFHAEPLLKTDPSASWNRLAPISSDSLQLKVKPLSSDEHGSFATAVLLSRERKGRHQRIFVLSDADYMTKAFYDSEVKPTRYNFDFAFWCFSKFTEGEFPANTLRPQTDDAMRIRTADLPVQKTLLYFVIPGLIAVVGTVLLLRRKSK